MSNIRALPHQRLYVLEQDENPERSLAVFVHGLGGNYLGSWGRLAQILGLSSSNVFRSWDYAFFGYDTPALTSALDVVSQLDSLLYDAQHASETFPVPYRRFAIVGHSLGALAARQLVDMQCVTKCSVGLIDRIGLIGEPLAGSEWAKLVQLRLLTLRPVAVLDDLVSRSTFTRQLLNWSECSDDHHSRASGPRRAIYHSKTDWVIDMPAGKFQLAANDPLPIIVPGVHWTMTTVNAESDTLCKQLEVFLS